MSGFDEVQGARMPFTVTLTVCGVNKRPGRYVTVSVPPHDTSSETAWAAGEGNTTPLIASAAAVSKVQRRIGDPPISQDQIRGTWISLVRPLSGPVAALPRLRRERYPPTWSLTATTPNSEAVMRPRARRRAVEAAVGARGHEPGIFQAPGGEQHS